jgi:hypothetical protein
VSPLADACDDLARWLPRAAALTAAPDTAARTRASGKPGSRPPWNPQAAMALLDALAAIADTEALLRLLVTGRAGRRRPASATGPALDAIASLGHGVAQDRARDAARELSARAREIQQLPALDEIERPQRVELACPYCRMHMMRLFPRAATVVCLRGGFACWDGDGNPPLGRAEIGRLGPCVVWSDGLVT